jgi:NADH:ubiquinone oxidoreductase subunit C
MYGIFFLKKKDSRNLLLDYGVLENPFLKSFPSIGYEEVYFDTVEKNVTYAAIAAVEL